MLHQIDVLAARNNVTWLPPMPDREAASDVIRALLVLDGEAAAPSGKAKGVAADPRLVDLLDASRTGSVIVCADCGVPARNKARGLCNACYSRHHRRGTLGQFPAGRPKPGRTPDRRTHGTRKGWAQHHRRGETPCQACMVGMRADGRERAAGRREYHRNYMREWQRRRRRSE